MAQVRVSEAALSDLESIYRYIADDSEVYAKQVVNKIYLRLKALEQHIYIGKVVPEFNIESIRELLEGRYRIIYQVENEGSVAVLRVYHGARLLKKI